MHRNCPRRNQSVKTCGATLAETMVATSILLTVIAVSFGSYAFLQRGLGETTELANARASQARVLDYLSVDLRNALAPVSGAAVPAGIVINSSGTRELTAANPLTLEIPVRYAQYEVKGHLTGDPKRDGGNMLSGETALNPTFASVSYTGTAVLDSSNGTVVDSSTKRLRVVYAKTANDTTLTRTVNGSPAREIAVFPGTFRLYLAFSSNGRTVSPQIEFTPVRRGRTVSSVQSNAISTNVFLRARYSK